MQSSQIASTTAPQRPRRAGAGKALLRRAGSVCRTGLGRRHRLTLGGAQRRGGSASGRSCGTSQSGPRRRRRRSSPRRPPSPPGTRPPPRCVSGDQAGVRREDQGASVGILDPQPACGEKTRHRAGQATGGVAVRGCTAALRVGMRRGGGAPRERDAQLTRTAQTREGVREAGRGRVGGREGGEEARGGSGSESARRLPPRVRCCP